MTNSTEKIRCLSRYELLQELGQGQLTRAVLAARRGPDGIATEALVVLRILHEELAHDDDFRALFLDRAARTLTLAHPALVRTEEVVADAELSGVSLEYLDGQPLSRLLARLGRNRLPVDVHLHLLSQLLAGLEHAHSGPGHDGFVHRNVCPSNVFITYDGHIKLLGTGFADASAALERRRREPVSDIRYAAPEVLLGAPAERSADLFSVGVLLWEAITQQPRVTVSDPQLIVQRRISGHEPDLERIWPEAPESLIELCGRALARDPGARHTSAGQLRDALDRYLARATQPSTLVLGRLPALLHGVFASEREERSRFIRATLEGLRRRGPPPGAPPEGSGSSGLEPILPAEKATPRDEDWRESSAARSEPSIAPPRPTLRGVPRVAPRATPSPSVLGTGATPAGNRPSASPTEGADRSAAPGEQETPPASARSSLPPPSVPPPSARLSAPPPSVPPPSARLSVPPPSVPPPSVPPPSVPPPSGPPPSGPASASPPSAPSTAPASERRDTDTGGHRAYSATLPSSPSGSERPLRRWGMLVLAGVLAAALGAGTALSRRSVSPAARPELEAAAPIKAVPSGGATRSAPGSLAGSGVGASLTHAGGTDAGAPRPPPAPAFFDGRAAAARQPDSELRTLSLDDLPTVDDSRESLQKAVLRAARARSRTLALRRKRLKKPAPQPAVEPESGARARRSIDETDSYAVEEQP